MAIRVAPPHTYIHVHVKGCTVCWRVSGSAEYLQVTPQQQYKHQTQGKDDLWETHNHTESNYYTNLETHHSKNSAKLTRISSTFPSIKKLIQSWELNRVIITIKSVFPLDTFHWLWSSCTNYILYQFKWDTLKKFQIYTRYRNLIGGWYSFISKVCLRHFNHHDVMKWKHFLLLWGEYTGHLWIHKGQWRGALIFSLISAWTNGWVNNRDASDLRRHRAHYSVTVMIIQ